MANTFKSVTMICSGTSATLYTAPANTTSIVVGCHVSNPESTALSLDMSFVDTSSSNTVSIASATPVPANSAYEPVGKLVMEAGDYLNASSTVGSTGLSVTLSVLEIT